MTVIDGRCWCVGLILEVVHTHSNPWMRVVPVRLYWLVNELAVTFIRVEIYPSSSFPLNLLLMRILLAIAMMVWWTCSNLWNTSDTVSLIIVSTIAHQSLATFLKDIALMGPWVVQAVHSPSFVFCDWMSTIRLCMGSWFETDGLDTSTLDTVYPRSNLVGWLLANLRVLIRAFTLTYLVPVHFIWLIPLVLLYKSLINCVWDERGTLCHVKTRQDQLTRHPVDVLHRK